MNIFASLDPSVKKLLGWKLGDEEEKWALKAVESLVKKLRKRKHCVLGSGAAGGGGGGTVEDLEYALAHPGSHSKCVTIPRSLDGRLQVSHRKGLPHVIYCRVWRWPNLQSHHELRPTADCLYPYDSRSEHICINPYHYQRVESSAASASHHHHNHHNHHQSTSHHHYHNSAGSPSGIFAPNSPNGGGAGGGAQLPCNHNPLHTAYSFPSPSASSIASNHHAQQQQQSPVNNKNNNNNNCIQQKQRQPNAMEQQQQQFYQQQLTHVSQQSYSPSSIQQQQFHSSASTSRHSPPAALYFGGCFQPGMMGGSGPGTITMSSSSSASVAGSAQSPSALSDDDDFGQIAAAAAAAASGFFCGGGSAFRYDVASLVNNNDVTMGGTAVGAEDMTPCYWCSICYYELNSRVGEPFKVSSDQVTVDGFTDPSNDEERICLGLLSNVNRNNTIECTRRHIGRGVRFACTDLSVTVLNLSESPVFVQSRNSNFKYNLQSTAVCRVPSNSSMVVFDYLLFHNMLEKAKTEGYNHVYDLQKMCFIRMSFVKGWGVDYHRQDVTSTPCWIELQLHRPLAWIDAVLAPMDPPDHLHITSVS